MVKTRKARAPDPRTDRTREALLKATISLGAKRGFDNISVRQIAQAAGANVAAVTYHFGSKDGLRSAVIDFIGEHMRQRGAGHQLRVSDPENFLKLDADQARAIIREVMLVAIRSTHEDSSLRDYPIYMQREIFQSGADAKHFFESVFKNELRMMCVLVSRVTGGDPDSDEVRLRSLAVIGQSVFMTLAQPMVHLAMGWEKYGDTELKQLGEAFWLKP